MSLYRIHRYAFDGDLKSLQDLLYKFPDRIEKVDDVFGRNIMHFSCIKGHYDIVYYILTTFREFDVARKDNKGFTCMHYCCLNGHAPILELLLLYDLVNPDDNENEEKLTPLHLCVQNGHGKCFKLLLQSNADFHIPDLNGNTVEDLCEKAEDMKTVYLSFLDGIFDIWEDRSDFTVQCRERERYKNIIAFPFFKFRLSMSFENNPGIRLIIKRLIGLSEGCEDFLQACSNYITKLRVSEWRNFLKSAICLPNQEVKLRFLLQRIKDFLEIQDLKNCSQLSILYKLFSVFKSDVPYPFEFVKKVFGTQSNSKLHKLLKELSSNEMISINFGNNTISISDSQIQIEHVSLEEGYFDNYLSTALSIEHSQIPDLFLTPSSFVSFALPKPATDCKQKSKKKIRKKRVVTKKKTKKKNIVSKKSTGDLFVDISDDEISKIFKNNLYFSKLSIQRGFRIALVIGNAKYENHAFRYQKSSEKSTSKKEKKAGCPLLCSSDVVYNDCTSISLLLEEKFGFHVTLKHDLSGSQLNYEIFRFLSIIKSLELQHKGKSVILFIYLTGVFVKGNFVAIDFHELVDHNFLNIENLYSEIDDHTRNPFDYAMLLMNVLNSQTTENCGIKTSKFPKFIPFQGFAGATNTVSPTFDGSFTKFNKLLTRYMNYGDFNIEKIFRKIRKRGVGLEYKSNYKNFTLQEFKITIIKTSSHSEYDIDIDNNNTQINSDSGFGILDSSTFRKLNSEIRKHRKEHKKFGFVIFDSKFSPPKKYYDLMMEKFREFVEDKYSVKLKCFKKEIKSKNEIQEDHKLKIEELRKQGFLKTSLTPRFKVKRNSDIINSNSNTNGNGLFENNNTNLLRIQNQIFSDETKILLKTPSSSSSSSSRSRKSSNFSRISNTTSSNNKNKETNINFENNQEKTMKILRSVWIYFPSNILSLVCPKSNEIVKILERLKSVEPQILQFGNIECPCRSLLLIFEFFRILFFQNYQDSLKDIIVNTEEDESEGEELIKLRIPELGDDDDVIKNSSKRENLKPNKNRSRRTSFLDEKTRNFVDDYSEEDKKIHELWKEYSSVIWNQEFLRNVIYNYDFQISSILLLDELDRIFEKFRDEISSIESKVTTIRSNKNTAKTTSTNPVSVNVTNKDKDGIDAKKFYSISLKLRKILFSVMEGIVKFFELKYILQMNLISDKIREECLKVILEDSSKENNNNNIVVLRGDKISKFSRSFEIADGNRKVILSVPQVYLASIESILEEELMDFRDEEFSLFLGIDDISFLENNGIQLYSNLLVKYYILIGCTSESRKKEIQELVKKDLNFLKYSHKVAIIDIYKSRDKNNEEETIEEEIVDIDVNEIREDVLEVMKKLGSEKSKELQDWTIRSSRK